MSIAGFRSGSHEFRSCSDSRPRPKAGVIANCEAARKKPDREVQPGECLAWREPVSPGVVGHDRRSVTGISAFRVRFRSTTLHRLARHIRQAKPLGRQSAARVRAAHLRTVVFDAASVTSEATRTRTIGPGLSHGRRRAACLDSAMLRSTGGGPLTGAHVWRHAGAEVPKSSERFPVATSRRMILPMTSSDWCGHDRPTME
jgi:hypothetical protein